MLIPAAPSTKSLQEPNVVRIVRLQAEIEKLENLREGKNENDRAIIDKQIGQRVAEQLILYRQLPGKEGTAQLSDDFKADIRRRLEGMHKEMDDDIAEVIKDAKKRATPDGKSEAVVNDSLKSQLAQVKKGLELFPDPVEAARIRGAREAEAARIREEREGYAARIKAAEDAELARIRDEREKEVARLKEEHDREAIARMTDEEANAFLMKRHEESFDKTGPVDASVVPNASEGRKMEPKKREDPKSR